MLKNSIFVRYQAIACQEQLAVRRDRVMSINRSMTYLFNINGCWCVVVFEGDCRKKLNFLNRGKKYVISEKNSSSSTAGLAKKISKTL